MAGFDLDQLRTWSPCWMRGSLTAAAPRVFLSQSSVSEQMRKRGARRPAVVVARQEWRDGDASGPAPAGTCLRHPGALSDAAYRDLRGVPMRGELNLASRIISVPAMCACAPAERAISAVAAVRQDHEERRDRERPARGGIDVGVSMVVQDGAADGIPAGEMLRREPLMWMAAQGARPGCDPLPLLALPETCALRQYAERTLTRGGIAYAVAHVAQAWPAATGAGGGLGVACLNESALALGIARLDAPDLPALPQAAFRVLPARPGEDAFVARAREVITQALR